MSHTLTLRLLGTPSLHYDEQPLSGFRSRKERALLYYLAVTGETHNRLTLAGIFWGDWPEKRALGNLRRALTHLRRVAGEHLNITRQTAAFDLQSKHRLDVRDFEQAVAAGEKGDLAALQTAVQLYRGDFLSGFYLEECPAFDEWIVQERERLHRLAIAALWNLLRHHKRRGEHSTALAYGRRMLHLPPWMEEAHREVMSLLALTGQRSAALAQ